MNYNTPDQITEFIDIENYKKQINNYWVSKPSKKMPSPQEEMPSPQEEWIEVITVENKLLLERGNIDKDDTKAFEIWKSLYATNNGKKGGILRRYRRQAKIYFINEIVKANKLNKITFTLVQNLSFKLDGKKFERSVWKIIKAEHGIKEDRSEFKEPNTEEYKFFWSIMEYEYRREEESKYRKPFLIEKRYNELKLEIESKPYKEELKKGKIPKI